MIKIVIFKINQTYCEFFGRSEEVRECCYFWVNTLLLVMYFVYLLLQGKLYNYLYKICCKYYFYQETKFFFYLFIMVGSKV